MAGDPFRFPWPVDQGGYKIERVPRRPPGLLDLGKNSAGEEIIFIAPAGGLPRYYNPLDKEELWLQFAETCSNLDGVLRFANEYGVLGAGANFANLDSVLRFANEYGVLSAGANFAF